MLTRKASFDDLVKAGKLKVSDRQTLNELMGVFDTFANDFGIVTP
ncbi:alkyl sulfatase C-terminal domain-containing protein [Photobacterium sp. R1]